MINVYITDILDLFLTKSEERHLEAINRQDRRSSKARLEIWMVDQFMRMYANDVYLEALADETRETLIKLAIVGGSKS